MAAHSRAIMGKMGMSKVSSGSGVGSAMSGKKTPSGKAGSPSKSAKMSQPKGAMGYKASIKAGKNAK